MAPAEEEDCHVGVMRVHSRETGKYPGKGRSNAGLQYQHMVVAIFLKSRANMYRRVRGGCRCPAFKIASSQSFCHALLRGGTHDLNELVQFHS